MSIPTAARVRCPITHCHFEHIPRTRHAAAAGHALPDGTLLAVPAITESATERRPQAHLVAGHSLSEWITEVVRLREILADPDSQVAAAREAQLLTLERARRVEAERDAALRQVEQLRAKLAGRVAKPGPIPGATPKAICPVCQRPFLLRLDGRIRMHNQPGKTQQTCAGSGAQITEPTPAAAHTGAAATSNLERTA